MPASESTSEATGTDSQLVVHVSHAVKGLALSSLLEKLGSAGRRAQRDIADINLNIHADLKRSFQKKAAPTARMALKIVPLCVLLPPLISTVPATDKILRYRKQEVACAGVGACFVIYGGLRRLALAGVKPPSPVWLLGIGYAAMGCFIGEIPYQLYHFIQK